MRILHRAAWLWRNLFDQRRIDEDLDDELRNCLAASAIANSVALADTGRCLSCLRIALS